MPFKSYCLRGLVIFFPVRSTLKTTKSSFPALPWNSEITSIKCLKTPGKLGQINRVATATSSLEKAVSKSNPCNTSHGLQMGSPRQDFRIKHEKASRHFNKTRRTFFLGSTFTPAPPKVWGLESCVIHRSSQRTYYPKVWEHRELWGGSSFSWC